MSVLICKLTKGWTIHSWLCERHRAKKVNEGWDVAVLETKRDDLACDQCPMEREPTPIEPGNDADEEEAT